MSFGKLINELILDNLRVWHTATMIKTENNPTCSLKEKALIYLICRTYNADRSLHKSEINKLVGEILNEEKVNY